MNATFIYLTHSFSNLLFNVITNNSPRLCPRNVFTKVSPLDLHERLGQCKAVQVILLTLFWSVLSWLAVVRLTPSTVSSPISVSAVCFQCQHTLYTKKSQCKMLQILSPVILSQTYELKINIHVISKLFAEM